MLTFSLNLAGLNAELDAIKTKAEQAIRPAAQAGAQVYYDAVKASAPKSKKGHWFHGSSFKSSGTKYWFESGNLKNAIYQVYAKDQSNKAQAEYQVAWNHRKVPYGFMVAYGTKRGAKANDFIGAARKTVQARAIEAMLTTFNNRISQ
jgi:HK97 gp10 family phage protein